MKYQQLFAAYLQNPPVARLVALAMPLRAPIKADDQVREYTLPPPGESLLCIHGELIKKVVWHKDDQREQWLTFHVANGFSQSIKPRRPVYLCRIGITKPAPKTVKLFPLIQKHLSISLEVYEVETVKREHQVHLTYIADKHATTTLIWDNTPISWVTFYTHWRDRKRTGKDWENHLRLAIKLTDGREILTGNSRAGKGNIQIKVKGEIK